MELKTLRLWLFEMLRVRAERYGLMHREPRRSHERHVPPRR